MSNSPQVRKTAVIAGAGPAGLTAAYELLQRTDILPIIIEKSPDIGGISRTVRYAGNRIDIGGHRFFSKSQRVMDWWLHIMPQKEGQMLLRKRLSRIYFLRRFFHYPVTLSFDTLRKLGLLRSSAIFLSYLRIRLRPLPEERSLEDFFINRFGRRLYQTFFKSYTEKVWGIPCHAIDAEWGAQRIKGLSVSKTLKHAFVKLLKRKRRSDAVALSQQDTETSLIDQFLYPSYGPGQLWEEVARRIRELGGIILQEHEVIGITTLADRITGVAIKELRANSTRHLGCDYFFSTMPVQHLVQRMCPALPESVRRVASGLMYRDFITVGLLLRRSTDVARGRSIADGGAGSMRQRLHDLGTVKDNWIYIQEGDVLVGRIQIFNNWSPFMLSNPSDTIWIGMEYFCQEGDSLWRMQDEAMIRLASEELCTIGLIGRQEVVDATVIRVEKAYPAYFGTYNDFGVIREKLSDFSNLFCIGRNGMHKYNNSDHSMLTAMTAVDNIVTGRKDSSNIWAVNTEQSYHETKS